MDKVSTICKTKFLLIMKKVQLYSGGMDSYIISKLWKPDVKLYIDYGIPQNEQEKKHLPDDVIIKQIDLSAYMQNDGLNTIPLRNLLFATIAINYGDIVCIGGLKSDLHYDKKPEFVEMTTKLFNSVLQKEREPKTVEVVVPFSNYTKTELICEFMEKGGTIQELREKTWSCHTPDNGNPCGHCQACKAREKAFVEAGIEYIERQKERKNKYNQLNDSNICLP